MLMKRFIKNNLYGLSRFHSSSGRDSRQTFCDITKGFIFLAVVAFLLCFLRNTPFLKGILDFFVLSGFACVVLCILFELFLLVSFACAATRRWQDLDIRIPQEEDVRELICRRRFWEVLLQEEGSRETNQYGPAPKDNPVSLVSEEDMREVVRKKLFVEFTKDVEDLK